MTDGFEATLEENLILVALDDANEDWRKYPGNALVPEDYEGWERRHVPARANWRDADHRGGRAGG